MLSVTQINEVERRAKELHIEPEALLAFIEVESAGQVFATVKGAQVPLIRWEGHYFDRLVKQNARAQARAEGLASPTAQAIKNSSDQAKRYAMLDRAKAIDYDAAVMSASWGLLQVMGEHWKVLGYKSAKDFEQQVMSGFKGQLDAGVRYLEKFNVVDPIRRKDWSAAARIYNGKNYKKFEYDTKMAAAYKRLTGRKATPSSSGMVRVGSKGAAVREVQTLLARAGYPVDIDGDFGPSTERAVRDFQTANGLQSDGIVGPKTQQHLYAHRQTTDEQPGMLTIAENKKAKNGFLTAFGGGVGLEVLSNKVDLMTEKTTAVPGLEYLASGLTVASVVIGIAGIAYGFYSFWQGNKTELGTR